MLAVVENGVHVIGVCDGHVRVSATAWQSPQTAHTCTALVGGELTLVLVSCMRSRYHVLYLINLAHFPEKKITKYLLEAKKFTKFNHMFFPLSLNYFKKKITLKISLNEIR